MDLHVLIREINGDKHPARVIYSEAAPVPEGMSRNHALHWMLAKIKEVFPVEVHPGPYDPSR